MSVPYTFYKVLSTDSIGDSLSSININYQNLDTWVTSIQLSAENLWIPLREYYNSTKDDLKTNVLAGETYKPSWDSLVSTIQTNSAKWLEPVVIVYPKVVPLTALDPDKTISIEYYRHIAEWFNTNFPVISSSSPLYMQNQKAHVFCFKEDLGNKINTVTLLQDSGTCYTGDTTICAYCTNYYSGYVYCSNGDFSCGGSNSCTECSTVPCWYDQTGGHYYNPVIQAYLNINFTDRRESTNISCLNFEIQNCQWVYTSQS